MKKKEFLEELDKILTKRNYSDKEEVLKDFEEHFIVGEQEGKSEEEISKLLGNPKDIADQFKEENEEKVNVTENKTVNKQENSTFAKLILAGLLIFFNIVFVFGIVVGLFGALLGLFIASIAIAISGVVLFIVGVLGAIIGISFIASGILSLVLMFSGIGVVCLRNIRSNFNRMVVYWICKTTY